MMTVMVMVFAKKGSRGEDRVLVIDSRLSSGPGTVQRELGDDYEFLSYEEKEHIGQVMLMEQPIADNSAPQPITCYCQFCKKEVIVRYKSSNELVCVQGHTFDVPGDW